MGVIGVLQLDWFLAPVLDTPAVRGMGTQSSAGGAAEKVRAGDKSQNGETDRRHDSAERAG
jgi:hypothetical protein